MSELVAFAVDVPDVWATAARLRDAGYDVAEVAVRFEEENAGFTEVFIRDAPPYFPFFISYDPPRAEIARIRAEHRAAEGLAIGGRPDLAALLARSATPEEDAHRLAELIGCAVNGSRAALSGAEVRFERGAPTGLYGIAVRGLRRSAAPTEVVGMTVQEEE